MNSLSDTNNIIQLIENNINSVLNDTLLYLFENSCFIYFEEIENADIEVKKEKFPSFLKTDQYINCFLDEPLCIFNSCKLYLENNLENSFKNTKKKIEKVDYKNLDNNKEIEKKKAKKKIIIKLKDFLAWLLLGYLFINILI